MLTRNIILMMALCVPLWSCNSDKAQTQKDEAPPTSAGTSAAISEAKATPPVVSTPSADISTWPAEIRADYEAIRKLVPDKSNQNVDLALRALTKRGILARSALTRLATDTTLPEPIYALAAFELAELLMFDPPALREMLDMPTHFAESQSVRMLAAIGGAERKSETLNHVIKSNKVGASAQLFNKWSDESHATDNELELLRVLHYEASDKKKVSQAAKLLTVDHPKAASWGAMRLVSLLNASDETHMQAAIVLAEVHADDIQMLEKFIAPSANKFLRLEAFRAISNHGEAGAVILRKALSAPNEPFKKDIETMLQ